LTKGLQGYKNLEGNNSGSALRNNKKGRADFRPARLPQIFPPPATAVSCGFTKKSGKITRSA